LGQPATVNLAPGTRQTVDANSVIGAAAAGPYSVSITATGPIEAESAQYYGGSPNTGSHPGVVLPAFSGSTTDVYMSDLANQYADNAPVNRSVYLYNPLTTPVQVAGAYYGSSGAVGQAVYTVPAGGIVTVNVNNDTKTTIVPGQIGAEFKVLAGTTGAFIAAAVGITSDSLSATEDAGLPAS